MHVYIHCVCAWCYQMPKENIGSFGTGLFQMVVKCNVDMQGIELGSFTTTPGGLNHNLALALVIKILNKHKCSNYHVLVSALAVLRYMED